jgi:hypothetical protein
VQQFDSVIQFVHYPKSEFKYKINFKINIEFTTRRAAEIFV